MWGWLLATATFFHHSPNLYETFDMDRGGSGNGSGVWVNTRAELPQALHNETKVEYSFTINDPKILKSGQPLSQSDFSALLDGAKRVQDHELASSMERLGVDKFIPAKFDSDQFIDKRKAAIRAAGFDGVTYNGTVCLVTTKNISDFHVVGVKGQHETKINAHLDGLVDKYPDAQAELSRRIVAGEIPERVRDLQKEVSGAIDKAASNKDNGITPESARHLNDTFARTFLDQVDGGNIENFNSNRLFLYEVDRSVPKAVFSQGGRLELSEPFTGKVFPARADSIGEMKDSLRGTLSNAISESDRISAVRRNPVHEGPTNREAVRQPQPIEVVSDPAPKAEINSNPAPKAEINRATSEPGVGPDNKAPSNTQVNLDEKNTHPQGVRDVRTSMGMGAAGVGMGAIGLKNAIENGDSTGAVISGADIAVSGADVALDASQAAGRSISSVFRAAVGKANIGIMAVDGIYQVSQEEGVGNKAARAGAVTATVGSALGVGTVATTVAAGGIATVGATVAAPIVAAVSVGLVADAAVDAYKATESLDAAIRQNEAALKVRDDVEVSGAPKLSNYRNLNLFAIQEGATPGGAESLSFQDKAAIIREYEYSKDPAALDDLEGKLRAKIDHYDQIASSNDSWVHDSVRFLWAEDKIDAQRQASMDRAPYVAAMNELNQYRQELAESKANHPEVSVDDSPVQVSYSGASAEIMELLQNEGAINGITKEINQIMGTSILRDGGMGRELSADEVKGHLREAVETYSQENLETLRDRLKAAADDAVSPVVPPQRDMAATVAPQESKIHIFSQAEAVANIQTFLIARGYEGLENASGDPTGMFGRKTAQALNQELKNFQESRNIPATGRYDMATREALDAHVRTLGDKSSVLTDVYASLRDGLSAMQDYVPEGQPDNAHHNALDIVYNKGSIQAPEQRNVKASMNVGGFEM